MNFFVGVLFGFFALVLVIQAVQANGCCSTSDCSDYRGDIKYTATGKTCVSWYARGSTSHWPNKGLTSNYCRNPSSSATAWCYTKMESSGVYWEYCAISGCPGSAGSTGATGPRGPQGYRGSQGPTGPRGAQGQRGLPGPQGLQGLVGPQGPRGYNGTTGPQGPEGAAGPEGATGVKGDKGDKGDKGEKGDKGDKGEPGKFEQRVCTSGTFKSPAGNEKEYLKHVHFGRTFPWRPTVITSITDVERDLKTTDEQYSDLGVKVKRLWPFGADILLTGIESGVRMTVSWMACL